MFETKRANEKQQNFFTFNLQEFNYDAEDCKMLILKDVTDQIEVNELRHKNEMINMLNATASHDMRAPLNTMELMIETVLSMSDLDPGVGRLLQPVRYSARLVNNLI